MAKIPVVFTFDKRIVFGAAVAIKSLIDCAKPETEYDIYVYHPDINDKTADEFKKMIDGTRHNITFNYISPEKFKDAPINKGGSWTEIVYYRLLIPELLTKYDKAIYSDVDVFFKKDLEDVYNMELGNREIGAVKAERNTPNTIGHRYFPENKNEFIFWSGFLLLNCKKLREEGYYNKFLNTIRNFKNRLKFFDLDCLNITCEDILQVPFKYCLLEPFLEYKNYKECADYKYLKDVYSDEEIISASKNPAIIHYAGELGKPWHRRKMPLYYKECADTIPKALKRLTFRDIRKRLLSKI